MGTILGIIQGLIELINLLKEAFGMYQKAKQEGWVKEGRELANAIQSAKTDDERRALLKRLVEHSKS